jgi:hypothetical protein
MISARTAFSELPGKEGQTPDYIIVFSSTEQVRNLIPELVFIEL